MGRCAWDSFAIPNLVKMSRASWSPPPVPPADGRWLDGHAPGHQREPLTSLSRWTVWNDVYAFEPAPLLFKGLRAGLARQHRHAHGYNHGSRHAGPGIRLVQRTPDSLSRKDPRAPPITSVASACRGPWELND